MPRSGKSTPAARTEPRGRIRITGWTLNVRWDQAQRNRVDAVPLIRWRRVPLTGEHVTEVAVAVRADHLGACRPERMIGTQDHRVGAGRVEERRPAAM